MSRAVEQELKIREARRARSREAKAARNRRKKHPCPTCEAHGRLRRSFGFAHPNDPSSESFTILDCPTCDGTGALAKDATVVALRRGERPFPPWEDVVDGGTIPNHVVAALDRRQRADLLREPVEDPRD